jgi:hypothetical protein
MPQSLHRLPDTALVWVNAYVPEVVIAYASEVIAGH